MRTAHFFVLMACLVVGSSASSSTFKYINAADESLTLTLDVLGAVKSVAANGSAVEELGSRKGIAFFVGTTKYLKLSPRFLCRLKGNLPETIFVRDDTEIIKKHPKTDKNPPTRELIFMVRDLISIYQNWVYTVYAGDTLPELPEVKDYKAFREAMATGIESIGAVASRCTAFWKTQGEEEFKEPIDVASRIPTMMSTTVERVHWWLEKMEEIGTVSSYSNASSPLNDTELYNIIYGNRHLQMVSASVARDMKKSGYQGAPRFLQIHRRMGGRVHLQGGPPTFKLTEKYDEALRKGFDSAAGAIVDKMFLEPLKAEKERARREHLQQTGLDPRLVVFGSFREQQISDVEQAITKNDRMKKKISSALYLTTTSSPYIQSKLLSAETLALNGEAKAKEWASAAEDVVMDRMKRIGTWLQDVVSPKKNDEVEAEVKKKDAAGDVMPGEVEIASDAYEAASNRRSKELETRMAALEKGEIPETDKDAAEAKAKEANARNQDWKTDYKIKFKPKWSLKPSDGFLSKLTIDQQLTIKKGTVSHSIQFAVEMENPLQLERTKISLHYKGNHGKSRLSWGAGADAIVDRIDDKMQMKEVKLTAFLKYSNGPTKTGIIVTALAPFATNDQGQNVLKDQTITINPYYRTTFDKGRGSFAMDNKLTLMRNYVYGAQDDTRVVNLLSLRAAYNIGNGWSATGSARWKQDFSTGGNEQRYMIGVRKEINENAHFKIEGGHVHNSDVGSNSEIRASINIAF